MKPLALLLCAWVLGPTVADAGGWYLLSPPRAETRLGPTWDTNRPLGEWVHEGSYGDAFTCERSHAVLTRQRMEEFGRRHEERRGARRSSSDAEQDARAWAMVMGRCIASDDPRLK
jgi:hypothetical protein